MISKEEKLKKLDLAIASISKQHGKDSVMKMGDKPLEDIEVIPTGSLGLDIALGVGGYPRGRIIEIYGQESSGKTTLTLHAIAEAQKLGGLAAFIDVEHAFDPLYAENLGVDTKELVISQPSSGEQALEIADSLIKSHGVDIIVIDSVAALVPQAELEGAMGDSKLGLQARLMSQALRKLTASVSKSGCVCIFINQLREKIGVMFGNPNVTAGGNALKYYCSVRMEIYKGTQIKEGTDVLGTRSRVKIVKNKVAPPFTQCEFDVIYGKGVSKVGEILDVAVEKEIINKSGAWYSYNGDKLGQGREAVKVMLEDNPELLLQIEGKVREAIMGKEAIPSKAEKGKDNG